MTADQKGPADDLTAGRGADSSPQALAEKDLDLPVMTNEVTPVPVGAKVPLVGQDHEAHVLALALQRLHHLLRLPQPHPLIVRAVDDQDRPPCIPGTEKR